MKLNKELCKELHMDHWDYVDMNVFWCPICKCSRHMGHGR